MIVCLVSFYHVYQAHTSQNTPYKKGKKERNIARPMQDKKMINKKEEIKQTKQISKWGWQVFVQNFTIRREGGKNRVQH